jgi:prepilin-type N-terminal cleavage/methylation domain-containing protein/prepilin-type processing-associated H-X9-DG protein
MTRFLSRKQRGGFTLVELLVVIAIVAVLIGLLLPAVQKVREAASRIKCANNLKQLALACHSYHDVAGHLPRNYFLPHTDPPRNLPFFKGSWLVPLLPYVEQDNLYRAIPDLNVPGVDSIQLAVRSGALPRRLALLRCPSDPYDPAALVSNYAGSSGPQCSVGFCGYDPYQKYCNGTAQYGQWMPQPVNTYPGYGPSINYGGVPTDPSGLGLSAADVRGLFGRFGPAIRLADATDGTTNTLLLGEALPGQDVSRDTNNWAHSVALGTTIVPINTLTDYLAADGCTAAPDRYYKNLNVSSGFRSYHRGGTNFALADGSVRFVSQGINHQTYQYLGCRNDGQVTSLD